MSNHRIQRVSKLVKEQIGEILERYSLTDCGFITVTAANISPDLKDGHVFVSVIGTVEQKRRALAELQHRHGDIQRELAHRIVLKYTPKLTFRLDETESHAAHIEHLLDELNEKNPNRRRLVMQALVAGVCILLLQVVEASANALVDQARQQIGKTTAYDPGYRTLAYPGGDVPLETGVCSDVIVRAFRGIKIDLQKEVHEDMERAFDQYPHKWGLKRPDANIDHRRVPNLMTYFRRKRWSIPSKKKTDFLPGDVVAWDLGGGITHIGIISDHQSAAGTPLVIHNIGRGVHEEDILLTYEVIGHYRPQFTSKPSTPPSEH